MTESDEAGRHTDAQNLLDRLLLGLYSSYEEERDQALHVIFRTGLNIHMVSPRLII